MQSPFTLHRIYSVMLLKDQNLTSGVIKTFGKVFAVCSVGVVFTTVFFVNLDEILYHSVVLLFSCLWLYYKQRGSKCQRTGWYEILAIFAKNFASKTCSMRWVVFDDVIELIWKSFWVEVKNIWIMRQVKNVMNDLLIS